MAGGVVFNHFPRIAAELKPACQKAVVSTALAIQQGAKANAPVDTGFMRDSIAVTSGSLTASIVCGAYYSIYVEMGHHVHNSSTYVPAHPFFYPAVDAARPVFEAELAKIWGGLTGSIA